MENRTDWSASSKPLVGRRICVIVTGGVPHPTRGASTVLYFQYIDAMLAAGAMIQCVLIGANEDADSPEPRALRQAVCRPDQLEIITCARRDVLRTNRFSLTDDSQQVAMDIRVAVSAFRPDAQVCFDLSAAAIGRHLDATRRLAWLGDLRFQTVWYHSWYNVAERPYRAHELIYAVLHCHLWRRIYAAVLRDFDEILVASHSSIVELERINLRSNYAPYPWPPLPPTARTASLPSRPTFLFFGNLVGLGSRSSLHMLIRHILPRLRRIWGAGGFEVRIAGREIPDAHHRRLLAAVPEVVFLGFVEDLAAEIGRAHAVLAPISVPVGNRSRILTALSVGAPVIAHCNAALGNPDLLDGQTCFLASDANTFVRHMRAAVEDPATAAAVGARGRAMYERCFAPAAATTQFIDLLLDSSEHTSKLERQQ